MPRLKVRLWVVVAAVLALVAGACGNDGGGSGSGDSGGDQAPPTQAQASAALLTTADVPSGWQGGESPDDGEDEGSDEFCDEFDTADDVDPAAEAEAEFAAAETGPFVAHSVALYTDEDEASKVMDLVEEALDKCKSFEDTQEGIGELKGSLAKASAPDLGDDAHGATITAEGTGVKITGDIVIVRQGRGIFMLMQFGVQVEGLGGSERQPGLTDDLAAKALAKLEAAA